jgi:hypothetical protein
MLRSLYTPNGKFFFRKEMNPLLSLLGMSQGEFTTFMNNDYNEDQVGQTMTLLKTFFKENKFYHRKPKKAEVNSIASDSIIETKKILIHKFNDNTFRFKEIDFYDVQLNIGVFTIVRKDDKDLWYEIFFKLTE